jgi:hypothetical protein
MAVLTKSSSNVAHPRISVALNTKDWKFIFLRSAWGDKDRFLGLRAHPVSVYYIFLLAAYVNVKLIIQIAYSSQVRLERGGPFDPGPWPRLAPSSLLFKLKNFNK